jgi:hypothetical protein
MKSFSINERATKENVILSKMSSQRSLNEADMIEMTKDTLQKAEFMIPGENVEKKKEWCVTRLSQLFEMFDNYIPVIGIFLDNPIVDDLEKQGIRLLVDWGWSQFCKDDEHCNIRHRHNHHGHHDNHHDNH